MSSITRLLDRSATTFSRIPAVTVSSFYTKPETEKYEEFRVLQIQPSRQKEKVEKKSVSQVPPPRCERMPMDQDWPTVWPGPRTFHPATVPLPIRQGYNLKNHPSPGKYGNAELMKIPNFLHLTPNAIKRHCEALKKFCTIWPEELDSDEKCWEHFPLEITTSDYCYSSPSIREPKARVATLSFKLSALTLDTHAKDKILRLLGTRYNPQTDFVTITADRCPMRKQNIEYLMYLLTAVYHESWRKEAWEAEKSIADMEYYDWEKNASKTSLISLTCWPEPPTDIDYKTIPHATEYKVAVTDLINNGEDEYSVNQYKEAVKHLLKLK